MPMAVTQVMRCRSSHLGQRRPAAGDAADHLRADDGGKQLYYEEQTSDDFHVAR